MLYTKTSSKNKMMKFISKLTLGLLIIFLVGCQSEVDKCVNSSMAAWDVKQDRIKKEWQEWNAWKNNGKWKNDKIISKENEGGGRDLSEELFGPKEKISERSRIEIESEWRVYCLQINSGK
jgi:hypothetical protein